MKSFRVFYKLKAMLPLVSVIIPSYNRFSMVREAIESVLNQSYHNLEIILMDDGSTDNTAILEKKYPIIYKKLVHSGFPGKVRNQGVALARGNYIAFLDSDDLWMPEKLEKQIEFFQDNPEEILCHTREIWDRQGKIISQRKQKHQKQGDIYADALKKCIIGPSTVVMKKEYFLKAKGFPEKLKIAEDYGLWLKITSQWKIGYLDIPLVKKRDGHEAQLSHLHDQIEIFRIQALGAFLHSKATLPSALKLGRQEMSRKCQILSRGARKRNLHSRADFYDKIHRIYQNSDASVLTG